MQTDVLIIGAGGAGLMAAIAASEAGANVLVLTKEYPTRSQTCMAQGGINAALGNAGEDSIEAHIEDTLRSAQGLADAEMVRFMCGEAPAALEWLDGIGVCFSRTPEGKIAQRGLGGASAKRASYAQDYTGLKILHTLYDRCNALGIQMLSEKYLLELLKNESGGVCGAKALDIRSGATQIYKAKSVVLATGGYSRIYGKNSTNSKTSTGDGIAVAKRAGAKLVDMEFVQFHPTGLKNSSILISESARGEGGYVVNSQGLRFTNELAPRDVLSRAINEELLRGEEVFLDIRHLGEERINEGLPQERKLAILYENVDPVESLIPIKPVAHYTMGGIEVDANSQTNVSGLFACGECANHRVHGANRLGGNSLLEIVVFGREAGRAAAGSAQNHSRQTQDFQSKGAPFSFESKERHEYDFYAIKEELAELLYAKVGIVRQTRELLEAKNKIEEYLQKLPLMGVSDSSQLYNTNLVEFLEFVNILELSLELTQSALQREASVGAHYRVG